MSLEDIKARYPYHAPGLSTEIDHTTISSLDELKNVKRDIKRLESQEEALSVAIKDYMRDAELLTCDGEVLCTF